jgi:hypothetical protein
VRRSNTATPQPAQSTVTGHFMSTRLKPPFLFPYAHCQRCVRAGLARPLGLAVLLACGYATSCSFFVCAKPLLCSYSQYSIHLGLQSKKLLFSSYLTCSSLRSTNCGAFIFIVRSIWPALVMKTCAHAGHLPPQTIVVLRGAIVTQCSLETIHLVRMPQSVVLVGRIAL